MNDTIMFGFPEAAARLGMPLRVLRKAIRAGRLPAPANNTATAILSAEWLSSVEAKIKAEPSALNRIVSQKVAPFARYEGTSCWRKYPNRVNDFYAFQSTVA